MGNKCGMSCSPPGGGGKRLPAAPHLPRRIRSRCRHLIPRRSKSIYSRRGSAEAAWSTHAWCQVTFAIRLACNSLYTLRVIYYTPYYTPSGYYTRWSSVVKALLMSGTSTYIYHLVCSMYYVLCIISHQAAWSSHAWCQVCQFLKSQSATVILHRGMMSTTRGKMSKIEIRGKIGKKMKEDKQDKKEIRGKNSKIRDKRKE